MSRPVDPDVARFAAALRERQAAEAREQERQAAVRTMAQTLERARAEKQAAVERLKDLRRRSAPHVQVQAAEASYRSALAALIELESGARPEWATGRADGPGPAPAGVDPDEG